MISRGFFQPQPVCDLDFQFRKEWRWQGCSGKPHDSILTLKQVSLPTGDCGNLRSSWHTWSMCYFLSPLLNSSFHWLLVLWLLDILRFWYVSWAQEYQSLLGFSSTNRTHRVHMKAFPKCTEFLQITVPFSSWGEAGEDGCRADTWQFAVTLFGALLLRCYSHGNNNNHLTHHPAWRMPELRRTGISRLYTCWIIVLSRASRSGMWASAISRTASLEQKNLVKERNTAGSELLGHDTALLG